VRKAVLAIGLASGAALLLASCGGKSESGSPTTVRSKNAALATTVPTKGSVSVPGDVSTSNPPPTTTPPTTMELLTAALVGNKTIDTIVISPGLTLKNVTVSRTSDGTIGIAATANIGSGGLSLSVEGSFTDTDNWSINASAAGLPTWKPAKANGLVIDPNTITGGIVSENGVVRWDLNGSTLTWAPDGVMNVTAQFGIGTTCPFDDTTKCPNEPVFIKLVNAQLTMPGVKTPSGSPLAVTAIGGVGTSGDWARLEATTGDLTFEGNGVTNPQLTIWYGPRSDSFSPDMQMPDLSSLSKGVNVEFCGGFSIKIPSVVNKNTKGCVDWTPVGFAMGQLGLGSSFSGTMPSTSTGSGDLNATTNIMGVGFTSLSASAIKGLPSPNFVFNKVKTSLLNQTFTMGGIASLPGVVGKAIGTNTDGLTSLDFTVNGSFNASMLNLTGSVPVKIDFGTEPLKFGLTSLSAGIELSKGNFSFTLGTSADATFGYSGSGGATSFKMGIALTAVANPAPGVALVANAQGSAPSLSGSFPSVPSAATYIWSNAFGIQGYNLWSLSAQIGYIDGSPALGYTSTGYLNPKNPAMSKLIDCSGACGDDDYIKSTLVLNVSLTEPCLAYGFDGTASNTSLSLSGGVAKTKVFKIGVAPNGCTVGTGTSAVQLPKLFFGFAFSTDIKGTGVDVITTTSDQGLYAKYQVTNFRLGPVNYNNVLFEFNISTSGESTTTFAADMTTDAGTFKVNSKLAVSGSSFNQHLDAYINASGGNFNWNSKSSSSDSGKGISAGDSAFEVKDLTISEDITAADNKTSFDLDFSGSLAFRGRDVSTVGSLQMANGSLNLLHFEFNYVHYVGGKPKVDGKFYMDWSKASGVFSGGVDMSYSRSMSYTYASHKYERGVDIRTYIDLTIDTKSKDAKFALGGSFKATNISGSIGCKFEVGDKANASCGGKFEFYKKDLFKKTFEWGDV